MAESARTVDTRVQQALDRFKLVNDAEKDQRTRELEDLRFARAVEPTDQWHQANVTERLGLSTGSSQPVAPRPCLTINKLRQPLQTVSNQAKSARLQLHFAPKGEGATSDTAEVYEDLARAIQTDSRAHIARNWAFDRAIRCGRGAYRIHVDYANDTDDDLDILYKRILNQAAVYFDPFAQEPDWSDGEWAMIVQDLPEETYKREYPGSKVAAMDDGELTALGSEKPGWIGGDKEHRTIRVAEYFYVKHGKKRGERKVMQMHLNCVEPLRPEGAESDEVEWNGRFIPIVPVIGDEEYINGERTWQGIVRPGMDAQRSYNVMRSSQVEAVGLAPKAPFIGAEGQFEGHEPKWNSANTRNWSYLEYKGVSLNGTPAPPPARDVQEPAIQAITMATQAANDDIHATTGVPPVSLGQMDPHERSGKAIRALQQQSEQGASGYLDNLASISMLYEGKILRDLIPRIYDRPGRIVHCIGADDQRRPVMLNAPFVMQEGMPVQAPPNTQTAKTYNLKDGDYTVAVKVGKSYSTKREEGAAAMGELISAAPQLIGILGDIYIGELDFPGARQAADRLKKMLPPQLQEGEQGDPAIKAQMLEQQMQQASQMIDMLTKELQAKTQIIETDAVKAQKELEREKMKQEGEAAKLQAETALAFREMEIKLEIEMAKIGSAEAMARANVEMDALHMHSEAQQAEADRGHETAQADLDRKAEQDARAEDQAFQADQSDRDRELAASQSGEA